jgi:hypothetical protein
MLVFHAGRPKIAGRIVTNFEPGSSSSLSRSAFSGRRPRFGECNALRAVFVTCQFPELF